MFDLRLYGDPYTIPGRVAYMRQQLAAKGSEKPILCTEYNGPGFFEFPVNRQYIGLVGQWVRSITEQKPGTTAPPEASKQNPITELYGRRATLAPETQMFLQGGDENLQAKFYRIQCRDLVMRNVLAFSSGVQKTMFWDLWHDTSRRDDLMTLMYGRQKLMEYDGDVLTKRLPAADVFQRMTQTLAGIQRVRRITLPTQPSVYLFEVQRRKRGLMYVVWERRDAFSGEEMPPVLFTWRWSARTAKVSDVFGRSLPATVALGQLHLSLSLTPLYVEPAE